MSLKTNISDMMVVPDDNFSFNNNDVTFSRSQSDSTSVLRENGSPRECQQRKESRIDPPGIENDCDALGSEPENLDSAEKKKKRRRLKGGKHHRKWKPYEKLSWNERRELEERETQRANQKREEAFAHGHPVAPYNTTQFLMDDHGDVDPNLHDGILHRHNSRESVEGSGSVASDSSDETYSSQDEESEFMEKEFAETYENMHAERLQKMSKEELIKDYLEMETKLDRLQQRKERRVRRSNDANDSSGSLSSGGEEYMDIDMVRKLENEQKKLKEENQRLKEELVKVTNKK